MMTEEWDLSLMLWENAGGLEGDLRGQRPPFSHTDAYLEGAANTCKGACSTSLSHLGVNLEIISTSLDVIGIPVAAPGLSAKHPDLPGQKLGWHVTLHILFP